MMKNKKNQIVKILFAVYLVIIVVVLVLKYPTTLVSDAVKRLLDGESLTRATPQFVPFKTIIEYAGNVHSLTDWFIKNLVCNVVMFVPWGILVPYMRMWQDKKYIVYTLITGMAMTVFIEVFQYAFCIGLMDIDDVILNFAGVLIGLSCFQLIKRRLIA